MASITDKPLNEKDDDELFILQDRSFQQGDGKYFLIENIIKRRLMEKQHELSKELMVEQHRYIKEQADTQHTRNIDLMNKQLRWIKFSAIINAIAILAAVLLGWYLQGLKSQVNQVSSTQQNIQVQQEASKKEILELRHERKNDKHRFSRNNLT